jgi:hypothetical protein
MTDNKKTGISPGINERKTMYPDEGYVLVQIDYNKPAGNALEQISTYESLEDIERIPPDTKWEGYVVYDSEGNAYSRGDL